MKSCFTAASHETGTLDRFTTGGQPTSHPHHRNRLGGSQRICRDAYYYVDHNQQYLAKNPFGYRCHANTGVRFPETA